MQASMVDSFIQRDGCTPACSTLCLPWMHFHRASNEETTEENKTPSRFVYSAKIHPFQYTSIAFWLQLVSAVVFPFSELCFKKQQVHLSLLSNVSSHGGSPVLPLPPMTSWWVRGVV